jgi:predicted ribosomally synthesized peptide with nif11-like leader
MSEEQLAAFRAKVVADTSLQEKLKAASDENAVIKIASEAGCVISTLDISEYIEKAKSNLSDEELENVSGGGTPVTVGIFIAGFITGVTVAKC